MKISTSILALAATALLGGVASAQAAYHVIPDFGRPTDMTPDGRYVIGKGTNPGNGQYEGFVWDWRNDPSPSYVLGDSYPVAISADGTVVAGNITDQTTGKEVAGRWTQAGGWVQIGNLGGPCDSGNSHAYDMSGDGSVIVGLGWNGCAAYPFRWSQATGMVAGEDVGTWHNPTSRASAVSRNGLRHAGFVQTTNRAPAFWEADGTGTLAEPLEVGEFRGLSATGDKVYGSMTDQNLPLGTPAQAIEWDVLTGTRLVLGSGSANGGNWSGNAVGVSTPCNFADRTVIGVDIQGLGLDAWIWRDDGLGIRRLNDVMALAGVPGLPALSYISAITDDGSTLVGNNTFGDGWIIELPTGISDIYSGCGGNPAGSLSVLCGTPRLGTDMVVGLDNPLGSMSPGALSRLTFSLGQLANPCGFNLPGYGMAFNGAIGELLITLPKIITISGAPWDGANPAAVPVAIPSNPPLLGVTVYAQGALVDVAGGVHIGLTEAIGLTFGN